MIEKTTKKIVVIMNKSLPTGVALNAAAHLTAGLCAKASEQDRKDMMFIDFFDKDETCHPSISALSLIILRGKSNEIRKVRNIAIEKSVLFTDFLETMTGETYIEQLEKTENTPETELNYYGISLFGDIDILNEFTRKLSLWRD